MDPRVSDDFDLQMGQLLEAIYATYHYDFRQYAAASLKRRLKQALITLDYPSLSSLQERILHDRRVFPRLLSFLTVPVSDLFRDPEYYRAVREQVAPILATYPSIKVWVAGCSTGEEAYSLAILLAEEGLLERTRIYATDINDDSLSKARTGIYELARMKKFTLNYRESGGRASLSDYYHAAHEAVVMSPQLKSRITFADHSLATDGAFSEMQLISCRNVLIYFDRSLQDRALGLFAEALCHRGFLGLGSREALRFSAHADIFGEFCAAEKIFRKLI